MNDSSPPQPPKKNEKKNEDTVYFLACEYRPGGPFWNVVDPFAYDVTPAFIYGTLGVLNYDPAAYTIVEEGEGCPPLMGYLMTISNPDMGRLLDRLKGCMGPVTFNWHVRKLVTAYTDVEKIVKAWCYLLSPQVLQAYQSLETLEHGLCENDPKQMELLGRIIGGDAEAAAD